MRLFPLFRLTLSVFFLLCSCLTALGASYAQITSAEMNDNGTVAFRAFLNGGDVFPAGLFVIQPGTPAKSIAVEGAQSPVAGLRYQHLTDGLALNNRGDVLFTATLDGDVGAILLYDHRNRVVRALGQDSGLAEGYRIGDLASFDLNDAGDAVFSILVPSTCSVPPCPHSKWQLYFWDSGTEKAKVIAETDQPAPGGGTIQGIALVKMNEQGTVVFRSRVNDEQDGFFRYSELQGLERLVVTGQPVVGFNGRKILELGEFGLSGHTVFFSGQLGFSLSCSPGEDCPVTGVFAVVPQKGITVIGLEGQDVGDTPITFQRDGSRVLPVMVPNQRADEVLFTGGDGAAFVGNALTGEVRVVSPASDDLSIGEGSFLLHSGGVFNDLSSVAFGTSAGGLVIQDASGVRHEVLDIDDPVPGFADSSFVSLTPRMLNNVGEIFFEAEVRAGSTMTTGLFVAGASGNTRKVAIIGELAPSSIPAQVLVFPQFADGRYDGGFIRTSLLLLNPSPFPTSATVIFTKPDGSPAQVTVEGTTSDRFSLSIRARGSRLVETHPGSKLQSGYVTVEAATDLSGSAIYSIFDNSGRRKIEVGILSSLPGTRFTFGVEADTHVNTAVAVVNRTDQTARLVFAARNQTGEVIATTERQLPPGQQFARYVFGEIFAGLAGTVGSLDVSSSVEVSKLMLRTTPTTITTLPSVEIPSLQ